MVLESAEKTGVVLVAEDCVYSGSVGQRLGALLQQTQFRGKLVCLNCGDRFVSHGSLEQLKRELSLDGEGIARKALEVLGHG